MCQAAAFRQLVQEVGLEEAYGQVDVVVASTAEFTSHLSLHLGLGPTDPPIRLRDPQLGGVAALPAGSGTDLVLPAGGARVLTEWLAGRSVELSAAGDCTPQAPRRELHTSLTLSDIGSGTLLLPRAISENGVVVVSSAEGLLHSPYGPLLGPLAQALYTCSGADSIGLAMPGLGLVPPTGPSPGGWRAAMPARRGRWLPCVRPCTGCRGAGCGRAHWRGRVRCSWWPSRRPFP